MPARQTAGCDARESDSGFAEQGERCRDQFRLQAFLNLDELPFAMFRDLFEVWEEYTAEREALKATERKRRVPGHREEEEEEGVRYLAGKEPVVMCTLFVLVSRDGLDGPASFVLGVSLGVSVASAGQGGFGCGSAYVSLKGVSRGTLAPWSNRAVVAFHPKRSTKHITRSLLCPCVHSWSRRNASVHACT